MIDAILAGRKTQTRRPIKPQPKVTEQELRQLGAWDNDYTLSQQVNAAWQAGLIDVPCPYGDIGHLVKFYDQNSTSIGEIYLCNIRVEQLQDISEKDSIAEGASARAAFANLWISIYGENSWESNPWVWVIEFRRINNEK
nr:hypothetical protein [Xenorhabdus sp. BG5]